jgi:hypothetical protein
LEVDFSYQVIITITVSKLENKIFYSNQSFTFKKMLYGTSSDNSTKITSVKNFGEAAEQNRKHRRKMEVN